MLLQQRKQFTQRHGTEFDGLRTKKEIEEEFKCARDGEYPAENVHDWTVTGRRNLTQQALFHYTDRQAGKGYSDFADPHYYSRPYIWPPLREMNRWYLVIFIVLAAFMLIDCEWFFASFRSLRKSEAATLEGDEAKGDDRQKRSSSENAKTGSSGTAINACSIEQSLTKEKHNGFRERRIIEYELSYEDGSSDIFMTPEDFVRSLTPGVMQPRRYGLDKYKMFNAAELPPSEFKLAFHVFDQNGDGVLDQQEFARVQELVLSQSNIGQRHRDHKTGTGAFVRTKNSMLSKHFFGEDGRKKLDIETFLRFQQSFHRDILKIEFERRDPESGPEGIISEVVASFAELLMIHSDLPEKRQKRMLKRVRKRYGKELPDKKADNFFAFIYHIDKVDLALHFYKLAGKPLSKQLLQRVARKVTGVELSDDRRRRCGHVVRRERGRRTVPTRICVHNEETNAAGPGKAQGHGAFPADGRVLAMRCPIRSGRAKLGPMLMEKWGRGNEEIGGTLEGRKLKNR
uniref:EF-hand domain-containing protein n=1 Tax=Globodera pallida TaxID=36090 RepID=A0A183BQ44_GLOPA